MKRAAPKKSKLDIKSIVLTTFISIVIFANVITVAMATPQSNEEYYNELFLATHISQIYSNQDVAASNVSTQNYSTTPYRITGHRESITEDEDWSWDGYYITEWRAAMENPAFFGTNGVVTRSIEAVNLSSLNASSLSTVDAFVATWWSVSDSSPFHGDIINFFLSGGDLVLMQDYTTHDGIGTALGIETTNGMTNPSSVSSPLQNGPFGAVSPFTINDGETHFSNSTIISLGGTICGVDGAGRATIACWERGQFSEGAGKLVIINDTEFITTINNEATYNPLNNKGRLALNLLDFLVRPLAADHYRIEHDGTGLTCEAESVTIKACANAKCTLLYDQTSHLRLSPSGWANGDNITFTGSTTAMLNYNNVETIRLSETLTSPDAPLKCFIGNTESCDLSFMNSSYPLVKTIEISSAVGSFLQVSEVVAWGASSNSDLALNTSASVSATGFYQGNQSCNSSSSDASCVLNGVGAEGWPNIYHSNSSDNNEILTVTLDIASDISSIEVFGRNNCCAQRDIYNIRLFDEQGVLLEEILSASANNSNNTTGAIALSGSVCVTNPDHYRIEHDGQGLTCQAEPVVIKACANSDCSELYSQPTTLTLIPSGWEGGDTLSFTGATSTTISHTTVQTITLGKLTATPEANMKCVNGVTETCNMDFVAAGFRFLNTSSGVSETITNQISGTNFPLRLQAVQDNNGVCEGLFSGDQNIDLSQENVDPSGNSGLSFSIDGNNIAKYPSFTSTTLNFSADSIATIPTPVYFDAGEIRLHADYDTNGIAVSGTSNTFWVSPAALVVSATAGATVLNGATATATPSHKAGEVFDLTVSAVNSVGDVTPNYSPGQIQFQLTRTSPTLGASVDGNLHYASNSILTTSASAIFQNVTLSGFSAGVSTYSAAHYSEVGLLNLDVQDSNYGNVGIAVSSDAINIGRFIPDHFKQTVAQNGLFHAKCDSRIAFTAYTGQKHEANNSIGAMSYLSNPVLAVTAYNKQGNITQNYYEDSEGSANDYMKLSATDITLTIPAFDEVAIGIDSNKLPLTANMLTGTLSQNDLTALPSVVVLPKGVLHYQLSNDDNFFYNRSANAMVAPFISDIDFSAIGIVDTDSVNAISTVDASPTGIEIRFGRVGLENSFGPETENLPQVLQLEHFDGASFTSTSDNSCVSYHANKISLTDISLDTNLTNLIGGVGNFLNGKTQSIELASPGAENQGQIGVSYDAYEWLKFDWNNDGVYDENPSAVATFGLYRGDDRLFHWREVL